MVLATDLYERTPGDKTWVHIDLNRMKKNIFIRFNMSDPTGLVTWSQKIGEVHRSDAHTYAGKFAPGVEADPFVPIGTPNMLVFTLSGLADFTATTNGQGWVTSIVITFKSSDGKNVRLTTTMSGFGSKLNLKAPPKAEVREIDNAFYKS